MVISRTWPNSGLVGDDERNRNHRWTGHWMDKGMRILLLLFLAGVLLSHHMSKYVAQFYIWFFDLPKLFLTHC